MMTASECMFLQLKKTRFAIWMACIVLAAASVLGKDEWSDKERGA